MSLLLSKNSWFLTRNKLLSIFQRTKFAYRSSSTLELLLKMNHLIPLITIFWVSSQLPKTATFTSDTQQQQRLSNVKYAASELTSSSDESKDIARALAKRWWGRNKYQFINRQINLITRQLKKLATLLKQNSVECQIGRRKRLGSSLSTLGLAV